MTGGWTDERKALAKEMWLAGHSGGVISRTLACGLSPSAIIGMLNRAFLVGSGLRKTKQPGLAALKPAALPRPERVKLQRDAIWSPKDIRAPAPVEMALPVSVPPVPAEPLGGGGPVGFFELRPRHCRRPLWGSERPALTAMRFCGATTPECSSWCRECRPIVFSGRAA